MAISVKYQTAKRVRELPFGASHSRKETTTAITVPSSTLFTMRSPAVIEAANEITCDRLLAASVVVFSVRQDRGFVPREGSAAETRVSCQKIDSRDAVLQSFWLPHALRKVDKYGHGSPCCAPRSL